MIDQIDDYLMGWVEKTLEATTVSSGAATVSLEPPDKAPKDRGINLYLLAFAENPPLQGAQRAPLQFWRRYLVSAWAKDPSEAHDMLGKLLFAAMEIPEYEVELDNIPPALWAGFGIPPRPAFILRVPVRKERLQHLAPLVREPLHVKWIKTVQLTGKICGPRDSPLSGVRVALMPDAGVNPAPLEYARLCPATVTDAYGLFTFASIPAQPRYTVFIHLKDQELFTSFDRPSQDDAPLILRWDLLVLHVTGRDGGPAAGGQLRFSSEKDGAPELRLVCEAGQGPLRSLRLEYPVLQLVTQLNSLGQGYLLLQEKALALADQWLPGLHGQLRSADQQPLAGAKIICLSLNLSASTDDTGAFILK